MLHVVDEERFEVTGDDPARAPGVRELHGVAFRLLVGSERRAVGLFDGFREVLVYPLLFNHHMRRIDEPVDEAGMVQVHLVLEGDVFLRFGNAVHLAQERQPERLTLTFLVTLPFPELRETLCGLLLCNRCHIFSLFFIHCYLDQHLHELVVGEFMSEACLGVELEFLQLGDGPVLEPVRAELVFLFHDALFQSLQVLPM